MFLVVMFRSGPLWEAARPLEEQLDWSDHAAFMDELVDEGFVFLGGPLSDETRVVLIADAQSEKVVRATFARDPWSETMLRVDSVERWTIRLDGRRRWRRPRRESQCHYFVRATCTGTYVRGWWQLGRCRSSIAGDRRGPGLAPNALEVSYPRWRATFDTSSYGRAQELSIEVAHWPFHEFSHRDGSWVEVIRPRVL